jgi:hypothetical protein
MALPKTRNPNIEIRKAEVNDYDTTNDRGLSAVERLVVKPGKLCGADKSCRPIWYPINGNADTASAGDKVCPTVAVNLLLKKTSGSSRGCWRATDTTVVP